MAIQELIDIVLIEDNEDHVELIRQTLEERRIANSITHFDNAEDALSYLQQRNHASDHPYPGVILLDLNLPGMNGHDMLKRIKADPMLQSIPVVILTTSSGEADLHMAYQNHANSYLVKPIDFEQFERMVSDLGLYWGLWNSRAEL